MIDLNPRSGYVPWREPGTGLPVSDRINAAIDAGLIDKNRAEKRREYLGGSRIGEPCLRRLYYEYLGYPQHPGDWSTFYDNYGNNAEDPDPFDGKTLRIFRFGHEIEALAARWVLGAGFHLHVADCFGEQFGGSMLDGRIQWHIDGRITGGPLDLPYPLLWENKGLNQKSWNDLRKHGLRKSKPIYYAQVNFYGAMMDLENYWFTAINKNTCELLHIVAPVDLVEAQRVSDRGAEVIRAADAKMPPLKISDNRDYYLCRMCPFSQECHG